MAAVLGYLLVIGLWAAIMARIVASIGRSIQRFRIPPEPEVKIVHHINWPEIEEDPHDDDE